jgi:predicted dehydrogenase
VDALYIATPARLHHEQAIRSAEAGKHILCEKPLGLTVHEAEQITEAARRAGVRLGTAFMMRFQCQHRAAKALIEEGKLGKPVYARAQLSCWYPPIEGAWRQDPLHGGGGSLMDMGGHCIDLLEMFFGPVRSVFCVVGSLMHPYRSEDSAVATLVFANGAFGTVDTFFCIQDEGSLNVLELYGSLGSILGQGTIGQGSQGKMNAYLKAGSNAYEAQQSREHASGIPIFPPPVNPYLAEIEEFSNAILECRDPWVGGELGMTSQRVLAACYESARSGRMVEL